jgi:hypothetical protein
MKIPDDYHKFPQSHWVPMVLLELVEEVRLIRKILQPKLFVTEITIMPKTIQVGQTAVAHITGTGSDGNPFKFTTSDSVSLAAVVPADVTFAAPTFNADGSVDVLVTGVNPDAGDAISSTVDGVVSNQDTLTITAVPVTLKSVSLTLE